jgi:hypothetical protein
MGFDYHRSRELAANLISWFGRDLELISRPEAAYDPGTGSPATASPATCAAVGAVLGFDQRLVDGARVRQEDRRVLMSARGLAAEPRPGDLVVLSGRTYSILAASPLMPADTAALYELHIREGGLSMRAKVRIASFSQSLDQGLARLTGRVAREIQERVAARTPVDTGRARAGWEMSGAGLSYSISNPVPYVTALEHGHSRQAPAGMVGITLAETPALVERMAREELP